jgi:hypothetical protein
MTHRPYARPAVVAVAALLLLVIAWMAVPGSRAGSGLRSAETDVTISVPEGAISSPDGSRRVATSRGLGKDGTVKLRSLLEIREGEFAVIEIPSECMKKLPVSWPLSGSESPDELRPGLLAYLQREQLEGLFAGGGKEDRVKGKVQVADGELKWQGSRMEVRGTILPGDSDVTFQLVMSEGDQEATVAIVTIPESSLLVLHSAPPNPEGLAIFVGGGKDSESDISKLPDPVEPSGE